MPSSPWLECIAQRWPDEPAVLGSVLELDACAELVPFLGDLDVVSQHKAVLCR